MGRSGHILGRVAQIAVLGLLIAVLIRENYPSKLLRAATGRPAPVTQSAHYQQMLPIHARLLDQVKNGAEVELAFVGDSIIEGWLTASYFPQSLNLGIGRDTISGLLARIDSETVRLVPVWYLGIGINDVLREYDLDSLPGLVSQLSMNFGPARILIWRAALPVQRPGWGTAHEQHRTQYNELAQAACARIPNCTFLPAPAGFVQNIQDWTYDGLHPNADGYKALTEQARTHLSAL